MAGAIAGAVLIDGGRRQARFSGESVRSHTDSTNVRFNDYGGWLELLNSQGTSKG